MPKHVAILFVAGFSRVRLLKVDVPLEVPGDAKTLEVRHQVELKLKATTYLVAD